ncbi:hypothetical protein [Tunturiibacter gelidoferens]|uniref:Uncharacterized protein n=1 Tax=Tunturiibacter gelidiferens TaxID=3069689 RepID=A0ACC5NZP3_9BACT|nr:hypothetical protein [Edaphobacter lichenicola]MBB5339861.1 hypothetical protein [Edaphobacter lichenicola]
MAKLTSLEQRRLIFQLAHKTLERIDQRLKAPFLSNKAFPADSGYNPD